MYYKMEEQYTNDFGSDSVIALTPDDGVNFLDFTA